MNEHTCPPNTFAYTVQPGDTFFKIAERYQVSLDDLIEANPQIPDPSQIQPGQIVCVPSKDDPKCPEGTFEYTVVKGDTLFVIAKKFEVSLDELIEANPQIPDPAQIQPGQVICIPKQKKHTCPEGTFAYTVQPGDTFFTIAKRYQVSLDKLIKVNPQIEDPSYIEPGDTLCIPNK